MSEELTTAIVAHILCNLGILELRQVSILSKEFLTDLHLQFQDEELDRQTNIWACETTINNSKLKIMCSYCDIDNKQETEAIVIIKLDNCPTYGCYYTCTEMGAWSMLAFTIKDNVWIQTTTYIMATFLAGMETMRDLTVAYKKCKETNDLFKDLKNFIKYYESMQE
jgi:hypothetical protein